jgi:hypothetical protein
MTFTPPMSMFDAVVAEALRTMPHLKSWPVFFSTETISITLLIYKCANNVIDIVSVLKPEGLQLRHSLQGICHFCVGRSDWWREDLMLPQ